MRCRSWALLQHRGGAVRPLERQALEHRRARTPLPTAVGPAADADQTVGGAADADLQTVGPAAAPNVTTTAGSGAPPGAVTPPAALSWRWRGRRCSIRLRAARSPKPSASGSSSGTFALPPRRRSRSRPVQRGDGVGGVGIPSTSAHGFATTPASPVYTEGDRVM